MEPWSHRNPDRERVQRVTDLRPLLAIPTFWQEDGPETVTFALAGRTSSLTLNYGLNFMYSAATEGDTKLYQLSLQRQGPCVLPWHPFSRGHLARSLPLHLPIASTPA